MLGLEPQKGKATWTPQLQTIEIHSDPGVSAANQALHRFVLEVTGRYLQCISDSQLPSVPFNYDRRDDIPGFLKLDVLYEFLVVGCDTRNGPVERFISVAGKAFELFTMKDQMKGFSFVPVVTFGEQSPYLFYVESSRGFSRIHPYFIKAAHRFVARQLLPIFFEGNEREMRQYVELMKLEGQDPQNLLRFEPLIRAILDTTRDEVHIETIKQIAAEIGSQLGTDH